jgi:hypothetical protein
MPGTNVTAYFTSLSVAEKNSFVKMPPGACTIKLFSVVIVVVT